MECDYEVRCINRKYEKMTLNDENQIKDWEKGETGFPLIDASNQLVGLILEREPCYFISMSSLDCDWKKELIT